MSDHKFLDRLSFWWAAAAAVGTLLWAAFLSSKVFLVMGLLFIAEGTRALRKERHRKVQSPDVAQIPPV